MTLPFATELDAPTGAMNPHELVVERRLSELLDAFSDVDAARALAEDGDPVVYRAFEAAVPHEETHLVYRTTVIEPGDVGGEFFMTKGHHHVRDSAELYYAMAGTGMMVMQDRAGAVRSVDMPAGTAVYTPPAWAHRTVNVGDVPLVFLAVFQGDAGHDYAAMEAEGFALRIVRDGTGGALVLGPDGAPARGSGVA
jgi:glucose-6-phosphate isomerase